MAELTVSPLLEAVIDKLSFVLSKEPRLLRGVKKDIEKLQSKLSTIKNVLEDPEQRSISDEPLSNWLKKLKDAAHDAGDVMDEIRRRMENHDRPLKGQVRDFFSSHNHIAFRRRTALKIKDLLKKLDAIAEEKSKFHLTQGSVSVRLRHEETHSIVTSSVIHGRDEDRDMVLNFLLNEKNDEDLSVLAITGLGRVGKTTLAQLVYNDERIKSSFHQQGWVCVSDEFDVRRITREIIESVKNEACGDLELDPLGQLLRKTLDGQRFMLVLDDVWNEDPLSWDWLKSLLRCGNKGSKIVVTTRNEHVASVMDSVLSHRLKGPPADDSGDLFRGEGGDSGGYGGSFRDPSDQSGAHNNSGPRFFDHMDYDHWRRNARSVKILLLLYLLLEFRRKRSVSPLKNYLGGGRSEKHQYIDIKIPVGGVSG